MIDFINCKINKFRYYGGKNGGKICIIYNNEEYMLKFPCMNEGVEEHEYSNSCISEYIACEIILFISSINRSKNKRNYK